MPAKKRTAGPSSVGSAIPDDTAKDDVAYKLKRQRNNDAVKKTRAKSKETANERKKHVELLKKENIQLETKIEEQNKNVLILKDLLMNNFKGGEKTDLIEKILVEGSDTE